MLPSPLWLSSPPRGSTLSHLAGVGGQPLAMGLGRSVRCPRYRARSNQAPASLPSPSARSGGQVLGWHGPRVVLPARRDLGGSGAVALAFARACSAGPPPEWRIASVTRLRRSRDSGLSAARLRAGTTVDAVSAVPAVTWSGPDRAREPRWAAPDQTHPPHPASGPLTSGRRSANGIAAGRRHRTPRHGLGRGPRADRVTRRCLRSRVDSLPSWFCARQMPAVPRA